MNIRWFDLHVFLTPEEVEKLKINSAGGAFVNVKIKEDVGFDGAFSEKAGAKLDFFETCVDSEEKKLLGRIRNGKHTGISFSDLNSLLAEEIGKILNSFA